MRNLLLLLLLLLLPLLLFGSRRWRTCCVLYKTDLTLVLREDLQPVAKQCNHCLSSRELTPRRVLCICVYELVKYGDER